MKPLVRRTFMRRPGLMISGLEKLVALLPSGSNVVEVGTWTGEGALVFLRGGVRTLIMVDPFDPARCREILNHVHHRGTTCEMARALVEQDVLMRWPNATLMQMTSVEAAARLREVRSPELLFDMVYIDACHKEWAVREDILAWRPLVKTGGWIAGHDYGSRKYKGLGVAVRDLLGVPDQVFDDSSWVKRL